MEIYKAHRQWASRPADERFPTLQALYDATKAYASNAREADAAFSDLRAEASNGNIVLVGKTNQPATLTNWAFGQLATRAGAPAAYLRDLPATLACQNLNHGLKVRSDAGDEGNARADARLLLQPENGGFVCRALTTDAYTRIWNHEVAARLLELEADGWMPAVPDTDWGKDVTALYASDRDMFAFIRSTATLREPGTNEPLYRGVIFENSEVGAGSLIRTRFLYRRMCGNHLILGASEMDEIKIRHVGDARSRWTAWSAELKLYANESVSEEEAKIAAAKRVVIGASKEQVLDQLFSLRTINIPRKVLAAGYDATVPSEDGSPNTVWGIAQGLTRHSQTIPYADQRTEIDKGAGRILRMAF